MSKVRSDNISNRADDGAPALVYGAEVPVGYGITGAGGINITGVATAASFSGATGTFTGDVDIADKIVHTGDTNTAIRFPAADTFTVETAGSERVRVDSSGNLGINATALSGLLTLNKGNVTNAGKWSDSCIALHNPTNIGAYSQIGFGYAYSGSTPETYASAYMGFVSTNQSSKGYGDFVFGTRNVSTDSQPTERLRITSAGEVQILSGNLKFSTAGKGIDFSATSDTGGMTSELLDDYEEGTWTPTWHGTLNSGTWAATGTYTKIGRTVTIQMAQTGGDVTFTVGGWIVGGLPFTPTNGQTGAAGDITDMSPSFGGIVSLQSSTRIYSAVAASNKTTLRINATFQV
jgi:hypothetical protein